jgi:hypothetical protein
MKEVYMVLYKTVNEMSRETEKSQGRDTINDDRQAVWTISSDTYIFSLTGLTWPNISLDWLVVT